MNMWSTLFILVLGAASTADAFVGHGRSLGLHWGANLRAKGSEHASPVEHMRAWRRSAGSLHMIGLPTTSVDLAMNLGLSVPDLTAVRRTGGDDFTTMSDEGFRWYMFGMFLAHNGIIPYCIQSTTGAYVDLAKGRAWPAVASGAEATVSNQPILWFRSPILLLDLINVVGRFSSFEEVTGGLETTEAEWLSEAYLRRNEFMDKLKALPFKAWPNGPDGRPVGSDVFQDVDALAAQMDSRELSEVAVNAVFDTFAGTQRSPAADKYKVDNALAAWHPDADTFDLSTFEGQVLGTRFLFLSAIIALITLQIAAFGTFLIVPFALRMGWLHYA